MLVLPASDSVMFMPGPLAFGLNIDCTNVVTSGAFRPALKSELQPLLRFNPIVSPPACQACLFMLFVRMAVELRVDG
jgi:hypothetical protein